MRTAFALVLTAFVAGSAEGARFRGSPAAQQVERSGWRGVREMTLDLDGDGVEEVAVVEAKKERLRVSIYRPTGDEDDRGGFEPLLSTLARPGREVVRLERARLIGRSAPEVLAVLEERTPDESGLTVVVVAGEGGPIREVFAETFYVPGASRADPSQIALGDATPTYLLEDVDGDGTQEIVWIRDPRTLRMIDAAGKPVTFVVGMTRTVFGYDPAQGRYQKTVDREAVDFLPRHPPYEVEASAQVKKVWGTAQPFWGTDGRFETSWSLASARARGQSLTVRFRGSPKVSLVRVVPGCAASERAWERGDRLRRFEIALGPDLTFTLDTEALLTVPDGVRAVGEFPLEGEFGSQVLIFLASPVEVPWARLTVRTVAPSRGPRARRTREVCVSDLSFH